jgi:uncharacterized YccA/Bax inhibitor family protein
MSANPVSVSGVINKSLFLFALVFAGCFIQWELLSKNYTELFGTLTSGSGFCFLISAIIAHFVPQTRTFLLPLAAFFEGLVVGGVSILFNKAYPGIVTSAIISTFCVFLTMLALYKTNIIKATEKFRAVVFTATGSIAVIYLLHWILSFFNLGFVSLYSSSNFGIGFSIFVIVIASLNFIVDFDNIEKAQMAMLDKSFELYLAFGLMVTFVWVYFEILKLLAKLNERR